VFEWHTKFQKKERMPKTTNDLEIGKDENCENMENVRAVVRRCRRLGNTGDKQSS
jgi:hypothetical protein